MWTGTLATWKCSKHGSEATSSRKRLRPRLPLRLRLRLRLHRVRRSAITFLIAFRKPSEGCPGYPWLVSQTGNAPSVRKKERLKERERDKEEEKVGERGKANHKKRAQSWNYEQAADHIGVFHNRRKANTWWKATAKAKGNYARLSREVQGKEGGGVGAWNMVDKHARLLAHFKLVARSPTLGRSGGPRFIIGHNMRMSSLSHSLCCCPAPLSLSLTVSLTVSLCLFDRLCSPS